MTIPSVDPPTTVCQALFPDPIPGIIPFGSLNSMFGAPGTGKTILMAEWLTRIRDGKTVCGHPTNKPVDFYYLAADRDWSTYAATFSNTGFPEIKHYVLANDVDFNPEAWKQVEAFKFLRRCFVLLNPLPGSLVVIDPVSPLFVRGRTTDDFAVSTSAHYYRKLAREYRVTLICMANVAKPKTEETYSRPQDRISGSGAWGAYFDTPMYLSRADDVLTLVWAPRLHRAEEFEFTFDEETKLFVPRVPLTIASTGLPGHLLPTLALIPETGTITSPELVKLICAKSKIKRAMAYRHIQQLLEKNAITQSELGVIQRVQPILH